MKRSEMVQGIKDYLDLTEEEIEFLPDSHTRANYILGFCEMLGMLPPPEYMNVLSLDAEKGVIGEISYPYPQDKYGQFPMWEPEDEEK